MAAVVAHDLQSEQLLRQKYAAFKSRFASEKELKGNSLFAKENNDALEYFLDNISGIDKMLREELKHLDVAVKFIDSQAEELIQLSDNVASIFCKIINTIVRCWDTKTEWSLENEWILTQSARFLQKIGTQNIKFTVPIQSWALAFCVKDMFAPKCSKEMRNNLFFNSEYQHWCQVIIQNIAESDFSRHAACFDELYSSGGGEP